MILCILLLFFLKLCGNNNLLISANFFTTLTLNSFYVTDSSKLINRFDLNINKESSINIHGRFKSIFWIYIRLYTSQILNIIR